MKAKVFPLWWNPWGEQGIEVGDSKVSISIDNLSFDKDADYRILFLAEPYAVAPTINEGALRNAHSFDKIYTFTQSMLDKYETAELFPWGASWLDFDSLELNKKPHITFVTSSKIQTPGHKLRLEIYDYLVDVDDVNGLQVYQHQSPPFHETRNDFFDKAMFHIAVENSQQQNYFTEKVIDCFASKTVPIYFGCPNLGDWFDMDGVITFNDRKDLKKVLSNINEDWYHERKDVIEDNYIRAKQFHSDNDVVPRLTRFIIEDVKENAIKRTESN
jgi:hypothetical protein|tara:strand:+ start:348 stop:1166 length:819 start_codon:yes stop_codon:yes gene_type:complete